LEKIISRQPKKNHSNHSNGRGGFSGTRNPSRDTEFEEVQKPTEDYAILNGIHPLHLDNEGLPDCVFLQPGTVLIDLAIEFKAPGKKPTPAQAAVLLDWRRRGGQAVLVDSVRQGKAVIDAYLQRKVRAV
jgi:hypothetical protein